MFTRSASAVHHNNGLILGLGGVVAALALGAAAARPDLQSIAVVSFMATGGALLAVVRPQVAVPVAISIGLSAGLVRRLLGYVLESDALVSYIVVIPALMLAISFVSLGGSAHHVRRKRLEVALPAFYVIFLATFALAGVNPGGAGIYANVLTSALYVAGAFAFVPYYRAYLEFSHVVNLVTVLATVNALYIIYAELIGTPKWDSVWAEQSGYASIYLGPDLVRPLGISSSVAESATLCAIGAALAVSRIRSRLGIVWLLIATLLGYALLVTGIRTMVLTLTLAIVVSVGTGRRRPWLTSLAFAAAAFPLVYLAAARMAASTSSAGVSRVATTLSGQESAETSTIPLHWDLMWRSVASGLRSVIGTGSGRIGLLSTEGLGSADTDLGNAALVGGVVGLFALLSAWWFFGRNILGVLRSRPEALPAVLVLIATFSQWITPNLYGTVAVVWAAFGVFARAVMEIRQEQDASVDSSGRAVGERSRSLSDARKRREAHGGAN